MITQLASSTTAGVRSVQANPGDWGIDTFVGELDGSGRATVWQSKFFIDGVSESQKHQIREAFKAAVRASKDHGYQLDSWILCIPCSMDGSATAWWDGWVKRQKNKNKGLLIRLWDKTELIKRLTSVEGERVYLHYYGYGRDSLKSVSDRRVVDVPESEDLDSTLFVRQLLEAGHVELDSAKREFYNAELVAREVLDKGIPVDISRLKSADFEIHAIWEQYFNAACEATDERNLPGLHLKVMTDIRSERKSLTPETAPDIVHVCGMVHRIVEDRRAGWVRDWRDVASRHHADAGGTAEASDCV